jgi:hypothetical protein
LKNKYSKLGLTNSDQKGFENCYAFIYYLEHGQIYYKQAESCPLILKPILLFYGLVHLIKACLLTINPSYPETAAVLAHGVTTRKRKKQNYQFFQDEIKFQKNGLFPYMSESMFGIKQLEGDKMPMEGLLRLIPELDSLFYELEGIRTFMILERNDDGFVIPEKILDHYHMSSNRFKDYMQSKFSNQFEFSNNGLSFLLSDLSLRSPNLLKFNLEEEAFAFPLQRSPFSHFPELLIHYLLLYNLSMIARYETEWWGELTKMMPTKDYPFIDSLLSITIQKSPYLIYQFLRG